MTASRFARVLFSIALVVALSACAAARIARTPVPDSLESAAGIPAHQALRFWGDEPAPPAVLQEMARAQAAYAGTRSGPPKYLTLSGGGHNGAFGAGLMMGWTARGDRPTFDVVTGISVGAMIAPMAFLGPQYDQRLQAVFVQLAVERDRGPGILGAIFGAPGIESNVPLIRAISTLIDINTVDAIAAEHRKGRRLFVGTTNLDAERPVIWDIGAIATSGLPERVELIRQVLLASAAVPGIFPPVLVEVEAAGRSFDEMHVDGGVTQNVLLFSGTFGRASGGTLYVIYNGEVAPTRDAPGVTTSDVVRRAIPALLKYQGRADLTMLAAAARSSGVTFRLSAVSPEFPKAPDLVPGTDWLNLLFEYGYETGRQGAWSDTF